MKSTLKQELFNLPNMLTLARIGAIPLVMLLIWNGDRINCVYAGWLYAAATITDFLDGWLARRQGLVTVMGKFLDPLADKLIVMAMLVMLVGLHRVPGWMVVLLLAREMTINGLRAIASSKGFIIAAGPLGKYKTAFQMMGVLFLVIHYPAPVRLMWFIDPMWIDFNQVGLWVIAISLVFSVWSMLAYFHGFFAAMDAKRHVPEG
ncbi:MAG: CDP-diacylglycerol--glycerol-3-phosphate 3-phosphatidyltransferase [Bradymonadia bacterium]